MIQSSPLILDHGQLKSVVSRCFLLAQLKER